MAGLRPMQMVVLAPGVLVRRPRTVRRRTALEGLDSNYLLLLFLLPTCLLCWRGWSIGIRKRKWKENIMHHLAWSCGSVRFLLFFFNVRWMGARWLGGLSPLFCLYPYHRYMYSVL